MASIAKNFAYNVILNVSKVIFPLITAPYVSRVLAPEGIGLYGFSNTFVSYFALVALLGIPTYGIREVAKCQNNKEALNKLVSQLMSIATICTLIVSAIYVGAVFTIPQLAENPLVFIVAGTVLYMAPFQIDWFFQGIERFDFITIRSLILRTLSIICIFIFVRTKDDLIIYVLISAAGTVVGNLWNFVALLKRGVRLSLSLNGTKQHLKPLLILFSSSAAISIYTVLDTLMLGFMNDYDQVGYYTNASHISKTILALITSLSAVAIPRVASYFKESRIDEINVLVRKSFSVVAFLAIPCTIGLICLSPEFVPAFFGESFKGVILPLCILSLLLIALGFNNLTGGQILIGMGFDKLLLWSVLSGAVLNFTLNWILIPSYGATGAAISSVAAETLILGITTYFVLTRTPVRITGVRTDIIKTLIACLPFLPIAYMLRTYISGWPYIIATFCIVSVLYIIIQILLKNSSCILLLSAFRAKIKK